MNIESSLERIAIALEKIAASSVVPETPVVETVEKKKVGRPPKVATPEEEMFSEPKPVYTQEDILKGLRGYKDRFGIEKTKTLMLSHGADKAKPVISSIPVANYAALMAALQESTEA